MKQFYLLFGILLSSLMFGHVASASTDLFSDVNEGTSGYSEIKFLVDEQIITPDTAQVFGINDHATRADVAYFLAKTLKLEIPAQEEITESYFVDVDITDERLPYLHATKDANLMNGYPDGTFGPDKPMTRAQIAILFTKAFALTGSTEVTILDVDSSLPSYHAIETVISYGLLSTYPNLTFKPNQPITKRNLAVITARLLNPGFRTPPAQYCVRETKTPIYRVDVAVTNLWHNYGQYRGVDSASISKPVNYDNWISSMELKHKKWLIDKTDTQALYNDEVKLLDSKGNMDYIAAVDQYVPYNNNGYPGWVPKGHVVKTNLDTSLCSIAIVTAKKATLYNEDDNQPFLEISYATILPVVKKENGYLHVQTPNNGVKRLKTTDAAHYASYSSIPKPSQSDIVETAKRFLGLKYLWAGTSSWGYDCSGITYAVYRTHGIMIPRDSFYQATKGRVVSKNNLQPGDLVFFAGNNGKGKVYHVGLYIGDGLMLHAPNYASEVKIEKLDSGVYKKNYAGARRYL